VLSAKPGAGGALPGSPSCGDDAQVPTHWASLSRAVRARASVSAEPASAHAIKHAKTPRFVNRYRLNFFIGVEILVQDSTLYRQSPLNEPVPDKWIPLVRSVR
jgi:hypothetical protein